MNVSLFGLGIIGTIWADHLAADGHHVRGWNRSPKTLPYFTPDAPTAAEGAEFLILVVADPPAVQSVLDHILPVLKAGQTVIQSSTIDAESSRSFARQVRATGAAYLEAPFTGSKPAAEARKTVFYTGGEPADLERARPLLSSLGRAIVPIGPVGAAASIKLALNLNLALAAEALCEGLAFARASGIDDETFFSALRLNAAWSGLAELKEPKLKAGDYAPQFSLQHMGKDLRLARAAAPDRPLPQLDALLGLYRRGFEQGWAADDFVCLNRLLNEDGERRSGAPA